MMSKRKGYRELGFAKVDTDRERRCGHAEVIYGEGKTPSQILGIVQALKKERQPVLITRTNRATFLKIKKALSGSIFHPEARIISWHPKPPLAKNIPKIAVCAAGSVDIPVAEEAAVTLEFHGLPVERIYDVGVAGIHRLLDKKESLRKSSVIIAIAGMEGALPSVIGGLVDNPIVAVPVSSGYGTALNGFTPLFAMLTSCASGITVVNINNGFGAAMAALRIVRFSYQQN